jgi:hypothetical protein
MPDRALVVADAASARRSATARVGTALRLVREKNLAPSQSSSRRSANGAVSDS